MNSGQNYDETAPRELEEELGVKASVTLIGSISARQETGWEHVRLYQATARGPFTLEPAEIETGGFFTVEQVSRWIESRPGDFAHGFLECFRLFLEKGI